MFAIGDREWAGTSKLVEEMGELQQVLGKLMGSRGLRRHWSGDLREKLIEEMADLIAAIEFFGEKNMTPEELEQICDRAEQKMGVFREWHGEDPE
jgi:NTP pyrophosphatase (non-canonical NTP hydrolase)